MVIESSRDFFAVLKLCCRSFRRSDWFNTSSCKCVQVEELDQEIIIFL